MQDFPTTSSSWSMAVLWQWSNHRLDSSGLVLSYFISVYVEMYLLFAVYICYRSFVFDEVFLPSCKGSLGGTQQWEQGHTVLF